MRGPPGSPEPVPDAVPAAAPGRDGVIPADRLLSVADGARVLVGGAVTHRQRPQTASGVTFINLEDETGMVNVVCSVDLWSRYRDLAHSAPALLVRGKLQNGRSRDRGRRAPAADEPTGGEPVPGTGTEVGTVPRSGPNKVRHDNDGEVMSKTVVVW